ncbi:putative diguanylate cyclase AdrA [compost metagenome]
MPLQAVHAVRQSAPTESAMPTLSAPDDEAALPSPATPGEERYHALTRLARLHFGVAAVSISIGQRLESWSGFPLRQLLPGDDREILVIADLRADPRFAGQSWLNEAPFPRFHASCPLLGSDGQRIGSFCLFDDKPGDLDADQRAYLRELAVLAAMTVDSDQTAARLRIRADALRESQRRMALAIAGSGTGIWDRDIPGNLIHYSSGWKALLGYTDAEVGNRIEESYTRIHPADLDYVRATMQAHFEQRTSVYEVEHRIRCKDGSYKWVCSRGKVVSRDSEGRPLRMIGTTTDITALRSLAERQQQTADLLTNLTNEVPGMVFQLRRMPDGESFLPYASAGIQDIYEIRADQVAASCAPIDSLIHPDDLAIYRASLETSAASLSPWHLEYRVCLPQQGTCWRLGDARPTLLKDGSILWHGFITDVTERKRIEAELHEFATTDCLTQVFNRRHFLKLAEAELEHLRQSDERCASILMCDLDHFKAINDRFGHAVGDHALSHFATILRHHLRRTDLAGRLGGEEFAVVLVDVDMEGATAVARRLQASLAESVLVEGDMRIDLTISIGISVMHAHDTSAEVALTRSDMALYRAKQGGRNRIECH